MTSTQSHIHTLGVPLPWSGECGKLWVAVDAVKLKQPDGELEERRVCKDNKEVRERAENFVPCHLRVPVPDALGDLPDPSL